MSNAQKEQLNKMITSTFIWLTRGMLAVGLWFLSEIYSDFKNVQADVQQVKIEVSSLKQAIDIIKDYDLKKK